MDVLLNWLVQGSVLAVLAAATLRAIPRSRTQARHGFVWTAYLALLVLPAVSPLLALARGAAPAAATPASIAVIVPSVWYTSATLAAGLWIVWFAVHALALGRDAAAAHHAIRRGRACPHLLLERLPHWSRLSATGRQARVVFSNRVRTAGVLGCWTPVIAIAPEAVDQLSAADLDRVLVHEWAHVQRRDDLALIVQRLVRAVVGWHPAAWWLERQLELERELACDEIAVRATGSARRYAECLVTIAAVKQQARAAVPVLAAVSRSTLHRRVERILAIPGETPVRSWSLPVVASALGVVACALAIGNVRVVASAVASAAVTAAEFAREETVRVVASASAAASLKPAAPMSSVVRPGNRQPQAQNPATAPESGVPQGVGEPNASEAPPQSVVSAQPVPLPFEQVSATPVSPATLPSTDPIEPALVASAPGAPATPQAPPVNTPAPWTRAADAGVAMGRASQTAGVATAGFFSRLGKKVAGSF